MGGLCVVYLLVRGCCTPGLFPHFLSVLWIWQLRQDKDAEGIHLNLKIPGGIVLSGELHPIFYPHWICSDSLRDFGRCMSFIIRTVWTDET